MMKTHPARPRTALLIGAALLATPAFAQDAPTQTVTPPPIAVTPAPAPVPAAAPRIEMAPSVPIVQPAPPPGPRPDPVSASPAPAERATSRATQTQQTTRRATRTAAPARSAAPAAAPAAPITQSQAPAPVAEAAAPAGAAPAPETAAAPTAAVSNTETIATQTATTNRPAPIWPWVLGGFLVVAGIAALLLMRRRKEQTDALDERVGEEAVAPRLYETPVATAVVAPRREPEPSPFMAATAAATAAPTPTPPAVEREIADAHVDAELAEPERDDLTGVADAPAPVANRPWLEFGLRPLRAGTSEEEALVDVELTVGNAGDVPARDVRISTFMLADAEGSEMENLLVERAVDTTVPPVTIAPGDGTRVDAHLAVPKGELGRVFNPVVVAEARYTLPDGREGRTSAMFKIGRPSPVSDGVGPIGATRPHIVESVEAELLGTPEHA